MLYFPTVEELKSDHIPEGTYTTGIDGSLMKGGAEEHIGVKDGKLNIKYRNCRAANGSFRNW